MLEVRKSSRLKARGKERDKKEGNELDPAVRVYGHLLELVLVEKRLDLLSELGRKAIAGGNLGTWKAAKRKEGEVSFEVSLSSKRTGESPTHVCRTRSRGTCGRRHSWAPRRAPSFSRGEPSWPDGSTTLQVR